MPTYDYKCLKCGTIEIFHSMFDDNRVVCPQCKVEGLEKQVSVGGGIIIANREANQYKDIKHARFWRDKNGVRHRVTGSDGYSKSATVTKKTATDALIKARKRRDAKQNKRMRSNLQRNIAIQRAMRQQNR